MIGLTLAILIMTAVISWRLRTMTVWTYPKSFARSMIRLTWAVENNFTPAIRKAMQSLSALQDSLTKDQ